MNGRIHCEGGRLVSRREFLKTSGAASGASVAALSAIMSAGLVSGCGNSNSNGPTASGGTFNGNGGDLGQGDDAIVNCFYAFKQMSTAFLALVTGSFYPNASVLEQSTILSIYQQEIVQRELLQAFLGASAIPDLTGFDFSSVPLTDRRRVLDKIREFKDVIVAGFTGSARHVLDSRTVVLLEKMSSVDARHSAMIRNFIEPNNSYFAGGDVVTSSGFEQATNPYYVIAVVRSYDPVPPLSDGDLP